MVKRLLAIAFIFCCTSIARLILGGLQFVVNGSLLHSLWKRKRPTFRSRPCRTRV
jgi:hypothetical protein